MILTTFSIKISGQTSPLPSSMNSSSITHQPQQQQQQQHPVHHPATITNHHHTTNVLSTMRSLNEKSRNLSKAKINTSKLLTPLDPNKLKLKLTIDSKFKETVHANKEVTTYDQVRNKNTQKHIGMKQKHTKAHRQKVRTFIRASLRSKNIQKYIDKKQKHTKAQW